MPTTQKTMVTITYNGEEVKLYENEKYISSLSTTTKPQNVVNAYLGGRSSNDRQYTGYIYNCMIYDRELSQGEICNNYEKNSQRYNIEGNNSIYIELKDGENEETKLININRFNKNLIVEYKIGENNEKWTEYKTPFKYTNQKIYARLKDKDGNILNTKEVIFGELETELATSIYVKVNIDKEIINTASFFDLYINNELKEKQVKIESEKVKIENLQADTEYEIKLKIYYWTGGSLTLNGNIKTQKNEYDKSGLVLWYDGINNTGTGNTDSSSTTWKDLVGTNDGTLLNFDKTSDSGWNNKGLLFDGVNDKVQFIGNITDNYTISLLVQPTQYKNSYPRIIAENPFPSIYLISKYNYQAAFIRSK